MKKLPFLRTGITLLALMGAASAYAQSTVYTVDPAIFDQALLAPAVLDPTLTGTTTQETTQTATASPSDPAPTETFGIMVPAATQETTAAQPTDASTGSNQATPGKPTQEVITRQTEELICETQETLECPAVTESRGETGWNDIPFVWFMFAGAGLGGVIWGLGAYMMNASQNRRQELKLQRTGRLTHSQNRLNHLEKAYPKISDSVAGILATFPSETGKKITAKQIRDYKKNTVELELNGSDETLQAHKEFLAALEKGDTKALKPAGEKVLNAIKKDLGV